MKKILFTLICLQSVLTFGQNANFVWAKSFGGDTGLYEADRSISVDASGNVYTTGFFEGTVDFDPGTGVYNLTSAGISDIFVQKLDVNGNFLWAKSFGGAARDGGRSISVDALGNVHIAGFFQNTVDFDPGTGIYNLTSVGSLYGDVFVLKLDTNGNFLWAKSFSGGHPHIISMNVDDSGNVHTIGHFIGTVDFDPGIGTYSLTAAGNYDVFVQKMDANGNFLWAKSFEGTEIEYGSSISVDDSGNIYTTGRFQGTVDFDPGVGTHSLTSTGGFDVFIQKMGANGNFLWAKSFGGTTNDYGSSISVDAFGNIYIIGSFAGTVDFDPGAGIHNLTSTGGYDVFVQKMDVNGNFLWTKYFGGTANDYGSSISVDASGNLYTTGRFQETVDFDPGVGTHNLTSVGGFDVFVQKIGVNGNFLWAKSFGGASTNPSDHSRSISVDDSGNVYTMGSFAGTVDFDPGTGTANLTSEGSASIFVHKMSQCLNSIGIDEQEACGSYTWIDGNTYIASNGSATYTLINAAGCDSIVTLNLTINQPTSSTLNITNCGAYTLNGQTYTTSGTYTQIVQNANNCDSTITLNLTVNQPTGSTLNVTNCGAYTLNGQTYTTSGTHTQVVQNANNCDSTITLNLTVNQPTSSTLNVTNCGAYTLNGQTYTTSGTYTQVVQNANNCDSTITLNLTVNQPTNSTLNITNCGAYILNGQTYTTSGTHTQVVQNANNCDSTITLNLTVNQPTGSTLNVTNCGAYTLNGQTYTTSGTYTQVVQNANNCDSTITLNLTVNHVNATVSLSGITIMANQVGGTYQWLDCNNGNTPISGATAQSFTPSENGNYAVQVTANGCTETSNCIAINSVGIESLEQNGWSVYPNPNNGVFTISATQEFNNEAIEVYSSLGQLIYSTVHSGNQLVIDLSEQPNGVYILKMNHQKNIRVVKL